MTATIWFQGRLKMITERTTGMRRDYLIWALLRTALRVLPLYQGPESKVQILRDCLDDLRSAIIADRPATTNPMMETIRKELPKEAENWFAISDDPTAENFAAPVSATTYAGLIAYYTYAAAHERLNSLQALLQQCWYMAVLAVDHYWSERGMEPAFRQVGVKAIIDEIERDIDDLEKAQAAGAYSLGCYLNEFITRYPLWLHEPEFAKATALSDKMQQYGTADVTTNIHTTQPPDAVRYIPGKPDQIGSWREAMRWMLCFLVVILAAGLLALYIAPTAVSPWTVAPLASLPLAPLGFHLALLKFYANASPTERKQPERQRQAEKTRSPVDPVAAAAP